MKRENIDHMEAAATIERIDAERAEHCKHFTDTIWGKADAYHLSLDSSFEPSEENATIIASLARRRFSRSTAFTLPRKTKRKELAKRTSSRAWGGAMGKWDLFLFSHSAFRHAGGSSFII